MTKILHIPSGEYIKWVPKDTYEHCVLNIEESWFWNVSLEFLLDKLTDPCFGLNIDSYEVIDYDKPRSVSEFEIIEDD